MTEESVRIPSEVEAAFILLREITRQLRQAEKDHPQVVAEAEAAYTRLVESTKNRYEKAVRTVARINSFQQVGEKNKQLLERAGTETSEIKKVRAEASSKISGPSELRLSELRQQREDALEQIANLAEPNGDSDID